MGNGFYELCQVARKTLIGKKEKRMHQPLILKCYTKVVTGVANGI